MVVDIFRKISQLWKIAQIGLQVNERMDAVKFML